MSGELVRYLSDSDHLWLEHHLRLAGVVPRDKVGREESSRVAGEGWQARWEREFRAAAVGILERQRSKHLDLIRKLQDDVQF